MQVSTPSIKPARRSAGRAKSPLKPAGTVHQHTQPSRRSGPPPCLATGGDDKPPSGGGPPGKPPGGPSDESGTGDHDPDDDEVVHLDEVCRPPSHEWIASSPFLSMTSWTGVEWPKQYSEALAFPKLHWISVSRERCWQRIQCTQEHFLYGCSCQWQENGRSA